ncbi:MAG: hypothetical protein JXB07_04170 [Anaerolineae bacterium]|nr:hypothetical protein [Anaerolineae bacterium]
MAEHTIELDEILDTCLARIRTEGWRVDDCLAHYPAYRDLLEPPLRIAVRLQQAQAIVPSARFKAEASERLRSRLQSSRRAPLARSTIRANAITHPIRRIFTPGKWRTLPAALGLVVLFSACTTGVVHASDSASPGDPLYGVDRGVEQVWMSLTPNSDKKLTLQVTFADERLLETETLAGRGNTKHLDDALNNYDQAVADITRLAEVANGEDREALSQLVDQSLSKHQARLEALLDKVPEQAHKGIERALEASQNGRDKAIEAINKHGEDHPGQGPPDKSDDSGPSDEKPGNGPSDKEDKSAKPTDDKPGKDQSDKKDKEDKSQKLEDKPGGGPPDK